MLNPQCNFQPQVITNNTIQTAWGRKNMKILNKMTGVLAALVLTAASASAVTVTVTHTGVLDYMDLQNPTVIDPNKHIVVGDQVKLSYSLDLDQAGVPGVTNPGTVYLTGNASLQFGTLGPLDLGPLNFLVRTETLSDGRVVTTAIVNEEDVPGIPSGSKPVGTLVYGDFRLPTPPGYSGTLTEFLNLDAVRDDLASSFFDMDVLLRTPLDGYSSDSCDYSFCFLYINSLNTSFDGLPDVPTMPVVTPVPVTPVPVPAPFLMLGMAMFGLIGFGRRAKL